MTPMKDGLKGSRGLVVDDNATNREILEHQLSAWGIDYRLTKNAEEAMHALHEAVSWGQPFNLAILDKQMPGTDGIDLARAIKQDPKLKQLHLVMLSSVGSLDETGKWMAAGVEAYLNKPIRQAELYSALATVLGRVEKAASSAPAQAKAVSKQLPKLSGHILIVEDNLVNQELAQRMLTDFGCRVRIVANGLEAVEAICNSPLDLANDPYDLILMDCQMPEMDGFEATAKIREHERAEAKGTRLPIVALTANAMSGDRENCIAAGMDDYLSKPFSKSLLFDIVQRWLPCTAVTASSAAAAPSLDVPPQGAAETRIDRAALERIRGLQRDGQTDVLGRVVRLYLENSPKILAEIEAAVAARDAGRLTPACASLRSTSASLGLQGISRLCGALQDLAAADGFERATVSLGILQFEHAAGCAALQQELDRSVDKDVA
jgi:CheY-like chemotaxis protein